MTQNADEVAVLADALAEVIDPADLDTFTEVVLERLHAQGYQVSHIGSLGTGD